MTFVSRCIGVGLVAACLMASACGPGDGESSADATRTTTTSSVPETTASSTTTTTTSTTTTSTTTVPVLVEVSDDANVLAQLLRIGVSSLEDQLAANASLDPMGVSAENWRAAQSSLEALAATDATRGLVDANIAVARDFAALFDEFAPILNDPLQAQDGIEEFLARNTLLAEDAVAADELLQTLAIAELAGRDEAVAAYVVAVTQEQLQSADVLLDIFGALELLAVDPVGAVVAMRQPVADLGELGRRIALLSPPATAQPLHDRQIALLEDYEAAFERIIVLLEAGEVDFPTDALLAMQTLAIEAPELNIDRTLFMAAVLAGEVI